MAFDDDLVHRPIGLGHLTIARSSCEDILGTFPDTIYFTLATFFCADTAINCFNLKVCRHAWCTTDSDHSSRPNG